MPYPANILFSRQQVQEISGIADDVLGYWMREGLLVPVQLPGRKHRRFSFDQIHLASILNEMRGLGANIGVLRKFAGLVQRGKALNEQSGLNRNRANLAASLGRRLDLFRKGRPISVLNPEYTFEISPSKQSAAMHFNATDEAQIIADCHFSAEEGDPAPIIEFARRLSEDDAVAIGAYNDLLIEITDRLEWNWVAWIESDGRALVVSGEGDMIAWGRPGEELRPARAAFYITISTCIRDLWVRAGIISVPTSLTDDPNIGAGE